MGVVESRKNPQYDHLGRFEFANGELFSVSGVRLDQLPVEQLRSHLSVAAGIARKAHIRIAQLEHAASNAGWAETARRQERSGGTM